ncbi:MAG: tripartite tricarboxylate transporter substrate binding protein [Sphaerochaetaceae bacterium]|nr:tripartite tricarboxylate transporter substrate binding protein [Sphaerochaetaceae bacterium]
MKKAIIMLLVVAMALTSVFAQGAGESKYPSKPVTAVVGWSAGGGADIVFRALADVFPKYADGQTMVVKNQPDAAGVPAITEFKNAPADGYQILHWNVAHLIKTHMNKVPFTATEFIPVCQVVASYNYLVVRKDAKWNTLADIIKDAKANPKTIRMGNAGAGGGNHLAALLFEQQAGAEFNHMPFKGGGPAITGLLAGDCDVVMANAPEGIANVQGGELKILAVFSQKRLDAVSDAPTGLEQKFDLVLEQWRGVVVPQGTPADVVKKLEGIFKKCVEDPAYVEAMNKLGSVAVFKTGEEYGKMVAEDDARYEKIIKEGGFGDKYK